MEGNKKQQKLQHFITIQHPKKVTTIQPIKQPDTQTLLQVDGTLGRTLECQEKNTDGIQVNRNYMSSIIAPPKMDAVCSLATRVRQLEKANKQLQDSIGLQMQFLSIHMSISEQHNSLFQPALHKQIRDQQAALHQQHSNRLLTGQIRVQEQTEMNELIKNYEGRIIQLHRALNNKEAEIAEVTEDEGHDTLPRRDNIRKLNLESIEKSSIHRALQEVKRLSVEIEALQYAIRQKTSKHRERGRPKTVKKPPGEPLLKAPATMKERLDNMHRDKLLIKVHHLLKEELAKENQLRSQLHTLKEEWETTTKAHQQLVKRYRKQECEKTKPSVGPKRHSQAKQEMNFLQELARAENQPVKEGTIFNKVDLNVEKQKIKRQRRAPSSRDRNKPTKQN